MSALTITDLPWPADQYRIDIHSKNFDPTPDAPHEDAKRAKRMRKTARDKAPKRAAELLELADTLDPRVTPQTPDTLASSRYFRDFRIRVIGAVWQLVDENDDISICRFDIEKPSWARSPEAFKKESAIGLKAKLRADLLRSCEKIGHHSTADINGFVFAFPHGELTQFDDNPEHIHPHFHLIAGGDWIAVIEKMRKQRGYRRTPNTLLPIRASRDLQDIPYALSYLLKSYWTCNGLVPVACLSLCHLSFESQGAYAAQI